MAPRPWGFRTASKLDMLAAYLPAFTRASSGKAPSTVYLDLFAGQSDNVLKDTQQRIEGSLRRALQTDPPFTVVRGFEKSPDRAASLQAAYRTDFPGRDVDVQSGDVHDTLSQTLAALGEHRRAPTFAFVDPDGVEARWEPLSSLAAHRQGRTKVEILLLLASPQIVRVVNPKLDDGQREHATRQIDDVFGCDAWQPILRGQTGILDAPAARDELTNIMRWRMENELHYKHTHMLRYTNVQGVPIYDMVFATDHPAGRHHQVGLQQRR